MGAEREEFASGLLRPATAGLLLFWSVAAGAAEMQHRHSTGHVPPEILQRPVTLRSGVGTVRDPVATPSGEARRFYEQGTAYLHSYLWIEAARSFNQALRLDPEIAAAHIGLSRAYLGMNEPDEAKRSLSAAMGLAAKVPPRERLRIELHEKRMRALEGGDVAYIDYLRALDGALDTDPGAPELWLLRGNAEEMDPRGIGQQGGTAALLMYRRALELDQESFAAHHYIVHGCENLGEMECAVSHGEAYARLAPNVPHARHMLGHNLRRVGRTAEAIAAFRAAYDIEERYYREENIPRKYDWHHPHNLSLLAASYQHQGRLREAEEFHRKIVALPDDMRGIAFYRNLWPEFLLVRGRLDEALAAARVLAARPDADLQGAGHALKGIVSLEKGDVATARSELKLAGKKGGIPGSILEGALLLADGKRGEGEKTLRAIQDRLRGLPGPDAWMLSLFRLELIARLAREAGDVPFAAESAGRMIEHDPAYGGSRLAAALAARESGEKEKARAEAAKAERLWRDADRDLPERRVLKELEEGQ
jgi:tetratricopeptide (TPR) repeat protein